MQKVTNIRAKKEPEYNLYDWYTEWLRCKQYIEDAVNIDNVGYNIDDVEENIANGTFQLWPGNESGIITSVAQYPQKSILTIVFSGGKMEELLEMLKELENFAKLLGCSEIRLGGRKGWKRVLKDKGFVETNIISKKIGK